MEHIAENTYVDDRRRLPSVGDVVEVWWDDRRSIFRGQLGKSLIPKSPTKSRKPQRQFRFAIYYDDGDVFIHDLNRMMWRFVHLPSNTHGKWIRPGDLETRAARAFKAAYQHPSSKIYTSQGPTRKAATIQSSPSLGRTLDRRPNTSKTVTSMGNKCSENEKAGSRVSPSLSRSKNDSQFETKYQVAMDKFQDDEKGVLEALLLLSDNSCFGSHPSSPVPYRKRHYVRYATSSYFEQWVVLACYVQAPWKLPT